MTEEFMQYAQRLQKQKLFEMEDLYQKNLDTYIPLVQNNFCSICEKIMKLQNDGTLGEISYLEYTLLHTNLIQKKDIAEVRVYDKNWYFDSHQYIAGSFDFSFLFTKYRELWSQLTASRKRFPEVTASEITAFLLSCASTFYKYVLSVCRFSIPDCTAREPFQSVQRAAEFEINVGEYMARTEAIYKENRNRTSAETLDWFSKRLEYDYAFEDFSGLDFSRADLSEIDLRYASLQNAVLAGTNFQDAMLIGTRFCHADMQNADLRCCMLHEADFTGANLSGVRFASASAYSGVPVHDKWTITGFRRVRFNHADLSHADFRRANIRDADFTGAVMDGALFLEQQLKHVTLSPVQKQAVLVTDTQTGC